MKKLIYKNFLSFNKNITDLYSSPHKNSLIETQCFYGDMFEVYEENNLWVKGKLASDNYIGWVLKNSLCKCFETNQTLFKPINIIYAEPNAKSKPLDFLFMGSKVFLSETYDDWAIIYYKNKVGYLDSGSILKNLNDYVSVALKFTNTQYLWGGKTILGIDCSGLLQLCFSYFGEEIPRNSGDQDKYFTNNLPNKILFKRGDLVFWPGHVGIMKNPKTIIHATAHKMKVMNENIDVAIKRLEKNNLTITSIKRL